MAVIFALTGALVAFLVVYFPSRQIDAMQAALRDKAVTYARLVSDQVESGVAFDDRETVREVFAATMQDRDVRGLALTDASHRVILSLGDFAGKAAPPDYGTVDRVRVARSPRFVRAVAPVVSREGPTGTLVLELSTDGLEAERHAVQRTAAVVGLGALAFGFAAAWWVARSFGKRLGVIAQATRRVAGGDLATDPVLDGSADEVGQLARSFNAMLSNLRALVAQIREAGERENERLEALVQARTRELDARNRDMRRVLDNVDQGLLLLDQDGRLLGERSTTIDRWFDGPAAGASFGDVLARVDPKAARIFPLAWEQLRSDVYPVELAIDLLPSSLAGAGREYEIRYTPLAQGTDPAYFLVVVSDVTERRKTERAEEEEREVVTAFERATRDRAGFLEFLAEAELLVASLCADPPPPLSAVKRGLHTLKGNASVFGLGRLAGFAHRLEDAMAERGDDLRPSEREALRAHWETFANRVGRLLGEQGERTLMVPNEDYEAALDAVRAGAAHADLRQMLAAWRLERVGDRFERIGEQARALAHRLDKEVLVRGDAGGLRLAPGAMASFWASFGHAVRNAISHGIESPEERVAAGKPEAGQIDLRASRSGDGLQVEIEIHDDGRGIDWDAVRAKARSLGLPAETPADLHAALFQDGLSTRDEVDDVSGRGVGMGALRAECERLGGRIAVASPRGAGTTVSFTFPAARLIESDRPPIESIVRAA